MHTKSTQLIIIGTGFLLLIPLIMMQFFSSWDWNLFDFIVMGILLLITGFSFKWLALRFSTTKQRLIIALVVGFIFVFIWAELAVGIFNIPGFSGS